MKIRATCFYLEITFRAILGGLLILAVSVEVQGQTTWNGGTGPGDFTNSGNWNNGAPLNQDALVNTNNNAVTTFLAAPVPNPYSINSLTVSGSNAFTFNHTSGTLTIASPGALTLGPSSSVYNLNGGTLQVGGSNGIAGNGTLNLGGGTLQDINTDLTTSIVTNLVSGTTSTIDTNGLNTSFSHINGSGSLNKIGAGNLNLNGTITLGAGGTIGTKGNLNFGTSGGTGTLNLNSGSNALITGQSPTGIGRIQIGYGGTGTLNISGGTITLKVFDSNNSLKVGATDALGNGGTGTANFSSGTIVVDVSNESNFAYGSIVTGTGTNSVGTFNQSGGNIIGQTLAFEVGVFGGTGTYTMTNNAAITLDVNSSVFIGDTTNGSGLLHISGNSTYSSGAFQTYLGTGGGNGTILQDGAGSIVTINAPGNFTVGEDDGSTGNYNLAAGTLNIVSGPIIIFGDVAGSIGNLNQTGGTLTASVSMTFGENGAGTYNLSGGTGTFSSGIILGNFAGSTGIINLNGTGLLQIGGANGITQGAGTAALNFGGGTLQVIGSNFSTVVGGTLAANTTSTIDTNGFNATLSGNFNGAGSLNKISSGTLNLSGADTYSGSTTISAGTLQAGSTTALSPNSAFTVNGTLDLNGFSNTIASLSGSGTVTDSTNSAVALTIGATNSVASSTFSGTIQNGAGTLSLDVAGGTLTLTGTNTYTGGTTLSGGTLAIGSLGALGTGNVINTGGTLTTAGNNHFITVNGNYTQSAVGTLLLNFISPIVFDSLNLTGAGVATVDGKLAINLVGGFAPGTGQTFQVVTTNTPVVGTFSSITTNIPTITATATYTDNVTLQFSQLSFTTLPGTSLTPNQFAVASYIDAHDQVITNSGFGNLVGALNSLSVNPQALAMAFDQLNPLKFENFASSNAFNNASFFTQQFDNYLANHRGVDGTFVGSNGGIDYSGLAVNNPNIDPGLQSVRSRLLAWSPAPSTGLLSDSGNLVLGGMDMKDVIVPSGPTNLWNVFVTGNVVLAQDFSDNSAGISGANSTTGAVQIGADYKITPHWLVGMTFGYGHTHATLDTIGSNANVNTYSPGVYMSYSDSGWYCNALGSYGFSGYSQNRAVAIGAFNGTAHSSPGGSQIVGDLDGGYDFHKGNWTFGPTLGLQYVHLDVDGYTETGLPGADLTVNENQSDSLRSLLGGRISYAVKSGSMLFTPHLSASWQHEFMDQSRGITSQFSDIGAGSFVVNTPNPSRESALIDLGFDGQLNDTITVFTDYSVQAGQSNYFGQSVQAGVKIGF